MINLHFAAWMRNTRMTKRLSVSECARRAGVSQPAWTEWEDAHPEKEWRSSTIRKIAEGLGVAVEEAMLYAGKLPAQKPNEQLASRLDPLLMQLPPDQREKAVDDIEQMAKVYLNACRR